jgi:hypothetical protein
MQECLFSHTEDEDLEENTAVLNNIVCSQIM